VSSEEALEKELSDRTRVVFKEVFLGEAFFIAAASLALGVKFCFKVGDA
jgi:hypothetical protein